MALSDADELRVEAAVRQMIAELRLKPSQEKEDGLGVEIAAMTAAEREHVCVVLLRIVAEERRPAGAER